ncbi:activator of (r)-2-hydroxyglutaryl-coa dehydratase [hydrocarbon metagenome]|uniref:Activator of (R)-2-hydroxyglutaryl-coa dehydratase n=1 Tax=hydrocarbon metagenome TaxID=938273 RepID=A0A0W8E879_9ZZZZ
MKTIGIPRGLFYYYYYPLYKTFFSDLGARVILSPKTTRITVDQGIDAAVDETCFPIKVYFGHVKELCKYELDYLFVPRLVSIEPRSYICPKFMGVPDMIRASFTDLPSLIDITVDLSRSDRDFKDQVLKTGRIFTRKSSRIQDAYEHGKQEIEYCRAIASQGYTMAEAIEIWEGQDIELQRNGNLRIGVLGHGYSLYDEAISMNIIGRLREMGCSVVLPEELPVKQVEKEAAMMPKRIFWTLGRKMVGSALKMEKMADIDGIIYVACFGCGPDSFVGEIIERKVNDKAYMLIVIDEHTGEGGLITRLEAFCDMLRRRRRQQVEDHISAYG